ncbi:amidohydrolase family protein [Candidatus Micrarchaeota archaeon]|nr:amidohydrolase family protein [Candidatus Micrarchaeota archaeon]MBD3417505.1 amidohydrolase family protein [Candidatus Micrarchaeota archaeon]
MIIKNAKFYLGGRVVSKDILIENGKFKGFGKFKGEGIDAKGLFALPGLIDPHVHLRDPGLTSKEDFRSGTRAALAGGFTTILDMPNTKPPTTTAATLRKKAEIAKKKAVCDYGLHFGATKNNFAEVKKAKPKSMKLCMGETTGKLLVDDVYSTWRHFEKFPKEKPLLLHAEDEETLRAMEKLKKGRGEVAEKIAVEKARMLAAQANRVVYFAHTTTFEAVHLAKIWGRSLVEATPHHLFLSKEKDGKRLKQFANVYPPLRSEAERRELWGALYFVDSVGSDHAPHTPQDKEAGAAGLPGLETSLALFLNAYNEGRVELPWIINRMAESPAKIFGLKTKGRIGKGYDGDLTLVDLKEKWNVSADGFESKCGWTPYEGFRLKGRVKKVILKGKLVVDGSRVVKEIKGKRVL